MLGKVGGTIGIEMLVSGNIKRQRVRPIDEQRLADQQVALDVMLAPPEPGVGTGLTAGCCRPAQKIGRPSWAPHGLLSLVDDVAAGCRLMPLFGRGDRTWTSSSLRSSSARRCRDSRSIGVNRGRCGNVVDVAQHTQDDSHSARRSRADPRAPKSPPSLAVGLGPLVVETSYGGGLSNATTLSSTHSKSC